jgi:Pectate lyase superfamily protein
MVMSPPVSASVPDLAMTIPTGLAAALGIWFATATAILISEAGVARRIAKFRLFSMWRALPVFQVPAALREQQSETTRQRSGVRPAHRQPASGSGITRTLLRIAAFAFGLGVTLPALAQTISGSSLNITGQSTLQGDVVTCSGHPWIDVRCNGATADGNHDDTNAINSTISTAIANNWPVRLTAGTYKVTSQIIIDYALKRAGGFA